MRAGAIVATAAAAFVASVGGALWAPGIVRGLRYEQQDPMSECASAYPASKTSLVRAEWNWFPPEVRCVFEADDGRERSLPAR